MIRLLDTCVSVLKSRQMTTIFLDGIKAGSEGFQALGKEVIY